MIIRSQAPWDYVWRLVAFFGYKKIGLDRVFSETFMVRSPQWSFVVVQRISSRSNRVYDILT
jgi:hypothetical protein